jgi:acetyl-CoA carboxylase biotin carboxyl carrier protein
LQLDRGFLIAAPGPDGVFTWNGVYSVELSFNDLKDLVAALSQSEVAELTLKSSEFELILRKQGAVAATASPTVAMVSAPEAAPMSAVTPVPPPAHEEVPSAPSPVVPSGKASDLVEITSPMVGTFYRAPAPDEPPFVSVGERITTGQTVCIIEAMKLMNELEAEVAGEIVEILVENSEPVEFGQTLMLVKPA